ncbi:NACHT, LRR and PYD domains-containing protein 1b allele 3-like [Oreochromis aureus]|uniref:NACHT, LRR and PYD domains-containing protein 1b allele 3-like n=1 Tax=Oreochromis aureus TaxID=47969 RepID=UPI001954EBF9|nr:NACHT, LRR and PYD domains-containing protein 1b allele 3-like [Oreochromis aureus]XP_039473383.1 NACHT, LRR and PYD domains-containing protein 1b allele 3-like [Oreochromis aureus]
MEDLVGGDCSSFLRRPSQILLTSFSRLFPYKTWSSYRLYPHIVLLTHWNTSGTKVSEKGTVIWRSKSVSIPQMKILTEASRLPDMRLKEFKPAITADNCHDETYQFQCSSAGLYQCSVTGLVFDMKGEGDVVYRTVPWNRKLLDKHHKKPAGPLFDIKCQQQSVCQLHLPHCELISTGGGQFLQVAHVNDEGIEFILPHQITESHVVINITDFSGYGIVRDEDSPPDPVQALVLLFYKSPEEGDLRSVLSVLLVPRNVVICQVKNIRRELIGEETYIDIPSKCNLHPNQVYSLSTVPDDGLIVVQPNETVFDDVSLDNPVPSFQVIFNRLTRNINLSLRHQSSSSCVWKSEVCLLPNRMRSMILSSNKKLLNVRSLFIDKISEPVLNSLLDKLLEKNVITDAEREAADAKKKRRKIARFVFDTVRRKGEDAILEMTESLCELDSFLCRNLGLL